MSVELDILGNFSNILVSWISTKSKHQIHSFFFVSSCHAFAISFNLSGETKYSLLVSFFKSNSCNCGWPNFLLLSPLTQCSILMKEKGAKNPIPHPFSFRSWFQIFGIKKTKDICDIECESELARFLLYTAIYATLFTCNDRNV